MAWKVVLPILLVAVIGGAVAAYYTVDSVHQTVARWLPGRESAAPQQPAGDQAPGTAPPPAAAPQVPATANPSENRPAAVEPAAPPVVTPVQEPAIPSVRPQAAVTRPGRPAGSPPAAATPQPAVSQAVPKEEPPSKLDKPAPAINQPPPPRVPEPARPTPPPEVAKAPVQPPAEPPVTAAPAKKPTPADNPQSVAPVPPRGTLQWTGDVTKDQTVVIEGGTASFGSLSGKLPRVPCTISVTSPDVSVAEAPGPSNSFDRIVLRFRKKGRISVTITWETLRQEMP